jgi:hypothetical protein
MANLYGPGQTNYQQQSTAALLDSVVNQFGVADNVASDLVRSHRDQRLAFSINGPISADHDYGPMSSHCPAALWP